VLPPTWSQGNPSDLSGDADAARYASALEIVLGSDDADAILVMNCPTALASSTETATRVADVVGEQRAKGSRTVPVLATWLGDGASRDARALFGAGNIANFAMPAEGVEGFMCLVSHARAQEALLRTPPSLPDFAFDSDRARAILREALAAGRTILSEVEAKALLAAYGIPVVATEIARTPQAVGKLAEGIIAEHGACAVKILSDDISHKSDVGGVRLGLELAHEAEAAATTMLRRICELIPNARIAGFTVQPMIRRPRAHELILGVSVDPTFGPLMMFGAGGTAVEVLRDTAHALPPLDANLAFDMINQTRVSRLLRGYRDRPAADLGSISEALVRLSYLASRHPEIREIDINPLLADEKGVIALDARVKIADAARDPRVPMSIRPYPSQWEIDTTLEFVGDLKIRPIRPEDEPLYEELFARVTAEDRRLRFFGTGNSFTHQALARFTQIDYAREMAFVAVATATSKLLGVARLIADPEYEHGEYAILVRSDIKGRGLGWRLMQHLIDYAKAEGLKQIHGAVLAENTTMLQMCTELGFIVESVPDDAGLMRVVLELK